MGVGYTPIRREGRKKPEIKTWVIKKIRKGKVLSKVNRFKRTFLTRCCAYCRSLINAGCLFLHTSVTLNIVLQLHTFICNWLSNLSVSFIRKGTIILLTLHSCGAPTICQNVIFWVNMAWADLVIYNTCH